MVKVVRQLDCEESTELVVQEHGITRMNLYKWKSKYRGMDVSRRKRLEEKQKLSRCKRAWR